MSKHTTLKSHDEKWCGVTFFVKQLAGSASAVVLLEVKKIPTELLCGLGDVYWEAESSK